MSEDSPQYQSVDIAFGAMSPPISAQLDSNGFAYDRAEIEHIESDAKAAIRLRVRGLLTDSQFDIVAQRMMKRIKHAIRLKQ